MQLLPGCLHGLNTAFTGGTMPENADKLAGKLYSEVGAVLVYSECTCFPAVYKMHAASG